MTDPLPVGTIKSIRDCGYDEKWLHDQVAANPAALQLGPLKVVDRERIQMRGGRLDMLLRDTFDDTMYEIELMLGETDESHIIRTIEYWDNEKRKWPQREHYAVLIAESITRRFFNVIQLLGQSIPIIAIQANIVEAGGMRILHFTKVMDTYEEADDAEVEPGTTNYEPTWKEESPWSVECAKAMQAIISPIMGPVTLRYLKLYMSLVIEGVIYFTLEHRSSGRSLLNLWFSETYVPQAEALLVEAGLSHTKRPGGHIRVTVDPTVIREKEPVFRGLATMVKESWK